MPSIVLSVSEGAVTAKPNGVDPMVYKTWSLEDTIEEGWPLKAFVWKAFGTRRAEQLMSDCEPTTEVLQLEFHDALLTADVVTRDALLGEIKEVRVIGHPRAAEPIRTGRIGRAGDPAETLTAIVQA